MKTPAKFLKADWKNLVMANFAIDPGVLKQYVPPGTVLDDFQGTTYVSVVAFQFLKTKVYGIPIPLHRDFEEINLRFYVRRQDKNEIRRGVVFIREIVPRLAIALVARGLYGEPYISMPTRSKITTPKRNQTGSFLYEWRFQNQWCHLGAAVKGPPEFPENNSLEEFISHHYWGYNKKSDGSTIEYQVVHPHWRVWKALDVLFECDVEALYGPFFASYLSKKPSSTFVAEGSDVTVYRGIRLK
jgi:uncharacterized protein YqjF (DUF2071 family)